MPAVPPPMIRSFVEAIDLILWLGFSGYTNSVCLNGSQIWGNT